MDRDISCLDYLAKKLNEADGVIESIERTQKIDEQIENVGKNIDNDAKKIDNSVESVPRDLVPQIKSAIMRKNFKGDTENIAKAFENAVKERIAGGQNVKYAVLDDEGFEIVNDDSDLEL